MRNLIAPIALVAALGVSSVALAAATTTEGVIKAIDSKAMTLTLANGTVFHLAPVIKTATLKPGEKVKVTWEKVGSSNDASAVVVVK